MKRNTIEGLENELSRLHEEVQIRNKEIDELRKSEKRYRDIFEYANDLIHSLNHEGKILYVNRLWRETLGYSSEEAKGMNIFDIVGANCHGKCKTIFQCLMRGEQAEPTETVFITKDGREISVEGRCNPKFADGKAIELLGIFRDITARKKLENERERLIAELTEALASIKTLKELLPICASCKKIRDEYGYWNQIESYIKKHSGTEFSHTICPECTAKLYPEYVNIKQPRSS